MANYLDANPDLRCGINHHRERSRLVPIAKDGEFYMLLHRNYVANDPLPDPLPIADYVVGLELLGHRFYVSTGGPGPHLYIMEPEHSIPSAWRERELALMSGRKGRTEETIAFLLDRDGGPTISRHRISGGEKSDAA